MQQLTEKLGAEPLTSLTEMAYLRIGSVRPQGAKRLGATVFDKDVLEIGCGHGEISCFLAAAGARSVVGIDLNVAHLEYARRFAAIVASCMGPEAKLPLTFQSMNAYEMTFPNHLFHPCRLADNTFEHFMQPETVMQQAFKVLRPGRRFTLPIFSSIYSVYGLHLKHGFKLPWANVFFSEKTILRRRSNEWLKTTHRFNQMYPGRKTIRNEFATYGPTKT